MGGQCTIASLIRETIRYAEIISYRSRTVGAYYERVNAGDDGKGEGGSCGYDEESEQRNVAYLWDR